MKGFDQSGTPTTTCVCDYPVRKSVLDRLQAEFSPSELRVLKHLPPQTCRPCKVRF